MPFKTAIFSIYFYKQIIFFACSNFALTLSAKLNGEKVDSSLIEFPSVDEGIRGMAFIDTVVKSNTSSEKWIPFEI